MFTNRAELHQLFRKQRVHHAEQQKHIAGRTNEMVGVGQLGGFGAARVNHDHAATARA